MNNLHVSRELGEWNKEDISLPSDHLTAKEVNGPVVTYRLGKPMSWNAFKGLPMDLRRLYLQTIQAKYGATLDRVAKMFGVSTALVLGCSNDCRVCWQEIGDSSDRAEAWGLFIGELRLEETEGN